MIKALILDLDNTLWDTTGQLVRKAQIEALKEMAKKGLLIKQSEAAKTRELLVKKYGQQVNITTKAVEHFGLYRKNKRLAEQIRMAGHHKYHTVKIGKITPFRDTIPTLKKLKKGKKIIVLLSYGVPKQQNAKIERLGIRKYFDRIIFDRTIGRSNKTVHIRKIIQWLKKKDIGKNEILLVGDNIKSEIEGGRRLGLKAVRMVHGRYSKLKPENKWQRADYRIKKIKEILRIINN